MIAFLLVSALAADPSATRTDPVRHHDADRCQAAVARKVKGEISNFDVDGVHRAGRSVHLKGTMNVLQRPVSRPGEMAPMHVISLRYAFDCRLSDRATARVRISQLAD